MSRGSFPEKYLQIYRQIDRRLRLAIARHIGYNFKNLRCVPEARPREEIIVNWKTVVELIGYLGSALVVVSMLMTSVVRLRIINLIGSAIFTVYALLIKSYPTAAMNLFLVGINIYHLVRLLKVQKHYDLIPADARDPYVAYLLNKNRDDIRVWFPEFVPPESGDVLAYLVCCDSNPAGLFLGRRAGDVGIDVLLDYATPVYRDTSVGRYLYGQLARAGYKSLVFKANAPGHVGYMEKVGYKKNEKGEYVLDLRRPA